MKLFPNPLRINANKCLNSNAVYSLLQSVSIAVIDEENAEGRRNLDPQKDAENFIYRAGKQRTSLKRNLKKKISTQNQKVTNEISERR